MRKGNSFSNKDLIVREQYGKGVELVDFDFFDINVLGDGNLSKTRTYRCSGLDFPATNVSIDIVISSHFGVTCLQF